MHNIKVSVITVVYNGVDTIGRTINSVLEQTHAHLEYIIIDGQSTDGTLAVIDKYRDKIAHVISSPDKGMYDAMNKGITLASGELIGIINSDDWYERDAVAHMVAAYLVNPRASIFHGLLKRWDEKRPTAIEGHYASFLNHGMIEHPTCFVRKAVYDQIGVFDLSYRYSSDYELMLRAKKQHIEFFFVPNLIANFSNGGVSHSFSAAKETLIIQYKYQLISLVKKQLLIFYWRLKRRK